MTSPRGRSGRLSKRAALGDQLRGGAVALVTSEIDGAMDSPKVGGLLVALHLNCSCRDRVHELILSIGPGLSGVWNQHVGYDGAGLEEGVEMI